MSEFLTHWNAPIFIIGGITVFLLLAWPMGSVPVAPKRRQKRIDTYFRSSLERSAPRAVAGPKASVETSGGQRGREINPATLHQFGNGQTGSLASPMPETASHSRLIEFRRTR